MYKTISKSTIVFIFSNYKYIVRIRKQTNSKLTKSIATRTLWSYLVVSRLADVFFPFALFDLILKVLVEALLQLVHHCTHNLLSQFFVFHLFLFSLLCTHTHTHTHTRGVTTK